MKEQKITKETIELAKNKYPFDYSVSAPEFKEPLGVPTQSEFQKWLREEHDIIVLVENRYKTISSSQMICKNDGYNVNVSKYYKEPTQEENFYDQTLYKFNTYEEALEQGLQRGLELI